MSIKTGSIPQDLRIFQRAETEIKFRWDDIEVDDFQKVTKCIPVFVADATNAKTQKTAMNWAEHSDWVYCPIQRKNVHKDHEVVIEDRPNTPISGVRLIGLEHRSQGGRAYKALVLDKYVFDFREDVLLDAILNNGILENGVLPGEYIFASVGSEMKLIRVGSLLHQKMIEATDYWKKEAISKLEPGGIYRNKVKTMLYLGKIYSKHLEVVWNQKSNPYGGWGRGHDSYDDTNVPPRSVKLAKETASHLFVDISVKNSNPISLDDIGRIGFYQFNHYEKVPKSFRDKVGHISGDVEDIISEIKKRAIASQKYSLRDTIYYARAFNASSKPGFVHPDIVALLIEQ